VFRLALRNLRAYAPRFVATALAVVVGIGFLAAGLVLTGAMRNALLGTVERQYADVDLAVESSLQFEGLGLGVSADDLGRIRSVPGVAAAAGELAEPVRIVDGDGATLASRTRGRAWIDDPGGLSPLTITSGTEPRSGGVVLDERTAAEVGLGVGDTIRLATPSGPVERSIVGTSRFGDVDSVDDGGTVSFEPDDALEVLGARATGWESVLVRVDGDVGRVAEALSGSLADTTLNVVTGQEFRESRQALTAGLVDVLRPVLNGFAWVALFVAGFVIANTFAVVVSQRRRELALVRAIGGTPGQVRRSLLAEGIAVGVIASILGIVTGALLARGVVWALEALGFRLPGAGISVGPLLVVGCVTAGTVVTTLSILAPAIRAGRTRPVEAMRQGAVDRSGTSPARAVAGGGLLTLGLLLLLGVRLGGWTQWLLGPGALTLFLGVIVGGPLLARAFALLLSPPARRIGLTARLAVDNTVRNPRRTATTANALVIGLFLVTVVTTSGEAFKSWATGQLDALSASDFIVASSGAPISDEVLEGIAATEGVRRTAPVRTTAFAGSQGNQTAVSGADVRALQETTGLEVVAGSLDEVAAGRAAAVVDLSSFTFDTAQGGSTGTTPTTPPPGDLGSPFGEAAGVGDAVDVVLPDGDVRSFPVAATLRARIDSLSLGVLVSEEAFLELAGEQPVNLVYVRTEPGAAEQVGLDLDDLLRDFTGIEVVPGNFLGQIVGQVLDFLIGAVNALLGISVVVALIGIVNTTTLSIHERRQELGVVRALGTTRSQVARTVQLESVLVAALGTGVGVGCGVLVGWVLVGSLGGGSVPLALNGARLGAIVGVGLLVGVLASVLPARRAVRVEVLEAIRTA
jgi:putative ABC transport system permease protein